MRGDWLSCVERQRSAVRRAVKLMRVRQNNEIGSKAVESHVKAELESFVVFSPAHYGSSVAYHTNEKRQTTVTVATKLVSQICLV